MSSVWGHRTGPILHHGGPPRRAPVVAAALVVGADPGLLPAPPAVLAAPGVERLQTWSQWLETTATSIRNAGASLGILLVGAVLLYLVLRRLLRKKEYVIGDVSDPPDRPGVGQAIRTQVLDEVRAAHSTATTFTNVGGANANLPAAAAKLPSKAQWLVAVMEFIHRGRRFTVNITTVPTPNQHLAIYVEIVSGNGRLVETRRFDQRETDLDGVEAYRSTAVDAGAWLTFVLAQRMRSRFAPRDRPDTVLLGTDSWESYAFLRHALLTTGNPGRKRQWLDAALFADPGNTGALIESALVISYARPTLAESAQAVQYLGLAQRLVSGRTNLYRLLPLERAGTRADPLWYQTTYALQLLHFRRYCALRQQQEPHPPGTDPDLAASLRYGTELSRAAAATWLTLGSHWRKQAVARGKRASLRQALRREGIGIATIVAGPKATYQTLRTDASEATQSQARWTEATTFPFHPRDLQRVWRRLASMPAPDPTATLENLAAPLPSAEQLLELQEWANSDMGLSPGDQHELLPHRIRYHRACVLAELTRYDEAAGELVHLLHHAGAVPTEAGRQNPGQGLLEWARRDPALASVRTRISNRTGQNTDWATLQELLAPRDGTPSPES